jgi:glycosyltransferase involved in cell wall biosynthesis
VRIVIATTSVPFVRGGAELHAENLHRALIEAGHQAEIVALPFKWYPAEIIPQQMLAARLFDLTESNGNPVDRVIGLKFPAYLVPHPNKVLWILHQHRPAYDLWEREFGVLAKFPNLLRTVANGWEARNAIIEADKRLIPEARRVFTNSRNVSARLMKYCGIDSTPLYHPPPMADSFYTREAEPFLFFPSRLSGLKRQDLVLEALQHCRADMRVVFAGRPDTPQFGEALLEKTRTLGVENRVTWLGEISDAEKLDHYARCLGVVYPPVDEDYGYITLEAMLASKPVVTTSDSGGCLEFVKDGEVGFVAAPDAKALAEAMDRLWADAAGAAKMGKAARALYESLDLRWSSVVETLLA